MSEPIFASRGGAFVAGGHARGPWAPDAQHGGAPAALLARAVERLEPGADMAVMRLTYEFLGPVPLGEVEVQARIARPGRRFQLVEAELCSGGRPVVLARAVRLRRGDVPVPDEAQGRTGLPCEPPDELSREPFPVAADGEEGFALTGMDVRFAGGTSFATPGPAFAWYRFARPLVDDETPTALQRVAAAADFANGASAVLPWESYLFVNTDLSIHLHREARGDWILLDARTVAGTAGAGLAAARLFDLSGETGLSAQTLFVDSR